jgi:phospholipase/carboxylesterase
MSRRRVLAVVAAGAAALFAPGCGAVQRISGASGTDARLSARPDPTLRGRVSPGLHRLGVADANDTLLFVPATAPESRPVPLVVSLHGAGHGDRAGLGRFRAAAERHGVAILLPESRGQTWDVVTGGYGPDVDVLDASLISAFAMMPVSPSALAIAGYSDGASYALSIGLTNGDLFSHIIACSPGFIGPVEAHARPLVFVSHGTEDPVLPIDRTSRQLVPRLLDQGYGVEYVEFAGRHEVPPEIADRAFRWFLRSGT